MLLKRFGLTLAGITENTTRHLWCRYCKKRFTTDDPISVIQDGGQFYHKCPKVLNRLSLLVSRKWRDIDDKPHF
jgi:hypothetical protein